jgi:hypothetical protein
VLAQSCEGIVAELEDDRLSAGERHTLAHELPVRVLDEKAQGYGPRLEPCSQFAKPVIIDARVEHAEDTTSREADEGGRHQCPDHETQEQASNTPCYRTLAYRDLPRLLDLDPAFGRVADNGCVPECEGLRLAELSDQAERLPRPFFRGIGENREAGLGAQIEPPSFARLGSSGAVLVASDLRHVVEVLANCVSLIPCGCSFSEKRAISDKRH